MIVETIIEISSALRRSATIRTFHSYGAEFRLQTFRDTPSRYRLLVGWIFQLRIILPNLLRFFSYELPPALAGGRKCLDRLEPKNKN